MEAWFSAEQPQPGGAGAAGSAAAATASYQPHAAWSLLSPSASWSTCPQADGHGTAWGRCSHPRGPPPRPDGGSDRRAEGGRAVRYNLDSFPESPVFRGPVPASQAARQVESNVIQPAQIQLCPVDSGRVSPGARGWGAEMEAVQPGCQVPAQTLPLAA